MKSIPANNALDDLLVASASSGSTFVSTDTDSDAEQQPLLPNKIKRTPLPKKQLAIICLSRLAEPIAYTQIFPYINKMVEELHVTKNPANVGFYSGLVDGLFSLAQLCTIFHWARLSDRIGRRPVIVSGLTGVCIGSLCFGLSTSLWQILLFRATAGLLSGNVAVIKSMIGEITDDTNQARAYPLESVTWAVGCVLGPLIGGNLSHPAERYPSIFGDSQLLKRRPYFLPCFVSSSIAICSILVSVFFLEETLPSTESTQRDETSGHVDDVVKTYTVNLESPAEIEMVYSAKQLLANPQIRSVMGVSFCFSFLHISWETVFVLFAYTPASLGGLQRSPAEIAILLATMGVLGVFLSLVAFPALQHRFGTLLVYRACMALWPIVFTLYSATSLVARWMVRRGGDTNNSLMALIWVSVSIILVLGRISTMSFAASMILLKKVVPNRHSVGATFGLSQMAGSMARAIGPAFVSSLFAFSVDRQILGGQFVWLVMFCIAVASYMASRTLK
ncbi:hypothetical protein FRB93_002914 [Tulasnella sp. JGI-2019a]|nr:hypothetical protein FRB93_002914 [Tulasnella sp. JGI-2019a]